MTPQQASLLLQHHLRQQGQSAIVRPALESGVPVIQVIAHHPLSSVPISVGEHYVVHRHPDFVPPAEYDNFGPVNQLAQSWTPHGVTRRLWDALIQAGFNPRTHPVVHDLAAGHGRLVEAISRFCQLVLNDLEPQVVGILRQRFPRPHVVTEGDFRLLPPSDVGPVRCMVGSPPWIEDKDGYLPQDYIDKAEELLAPGGICAFVLPDWFVPRTALTHIRTVRPTAAEKGHAAKQWTQQPLVVTYRKEL